MSDGNNSNDGLFLVVLVLLVVCGLFYGIWVVFKAPLLQGYLWLRQGEMAVASLWTEDDYVVNIVANDKPSQMSFGEAKNLINSLTPETLLRDDVNHWEIIYATSLAALQPLRILFGGLFAFLIYCVLFHGPTSYFRSTYNLASLMNIQSRTFRIIKPLLNFNPLKDVKPRPPGSPVPAELPLFAEALGPEEWIAFNKIPLPDGQLDQEAAERAFEKQLGDPWQGAKKLPPYLQVLLAAFALKTARKRSESDDMLGQIAECWDYKGGLSLNSTLVSEARKILSNKDIAGDTISECNRHAYVSTAMVGALEKARSEGGVLAPAQFLWMRGHHRELWYPLNNLGRQSLHMEAMGAMSHYRAEKQVQRPIPKPMMNDAVKALTAYVANPKEIQPIPQLDFSMIKNKKAPNKNKGVMKPAGT